MPIDPPPVTPAQRRAGYALLALVLVGILGIAGGVVAMLPRGPAKPAMSVVGGPFRLQSSKGGILDSATLADLTNLIDDLHKAGGDIGAYYITLDPERDDAGVLRDYMGSFSDSITGLTGTREEIDRVARSYRVFSKKVPLPGGDYTLEHTLMVYLMDRNGGFVGPLDLAAGHGLALRQIQAVL